MNKVQIVKGGFGRLQSVLVPFPPPTQNDPSWNRTACRGRLVGAFLASSARILVAKTH